MSGQNRLYLRSTSENANPSARMIERRSRWFNLFLSALLLVILSPILAIIALILAIQLRASPFYSHPRIGLNGQRFRCYKFRTMHRDASARLWSLLSTNPDAQIEWARTQKLRDDPRVAGRMAQFLRASGLDELPQLWNVLRGDMDVVGPRPKTAEEIARFQFLRATLLSVRPGLTGHWQIQPNRNAMSFQERMTYELRSVHERKIHQQLRVLARSLNRVRALDGL